MKYTSKQEAAALAVSSVLGKEQGFVEGLGGDTQHFPSLLHDAIFNESIKTTKT